MVLNCSFDIMKMDVWFGMKFVVVLFVYLVFCVFFVFGVLFGGWINGCIMYYGLLNGGGM